MNFFRKAKMILYQKLNVIRYLLFKITITMRTANTIHIPPPARRQPGQPGPTIQYASPPRIGSPSYGNIPPPQAVISHVPLQKHQSQPPRVNPQGHVNLKVNDKATLIGGAPGDKTDINLHVNVHENYPQPGHIQGAQFVQGPQAGYYPNIAHYQQAFMPAQCLGPVNYFPLQQYPAYIHPMNEEDIEEFEYYAPDLIEEPVFCVLCQETYQVKDRETHLMKHQRIPRQPKRINKIEQYKFDTDPLVRPIVEPEEFNIQYKPNKFVLDQATNFNTQAHGDKVSLGIGTTEETVSPRSAGMGRQTKSRFDTIHEEDEEQHSPNRPSTNYNNDFSKESPQDSSFSGQRISVNKNMIAPPSMDRKLDQSGDRFQSSYNPSTDRERFARDSYAGDQRDSYHHQQSVINVRESLKSSDDVDGRNAGQGQMYRSREPISQRQEEQSGMQSPMRGSREQHQDYEESMRRSNASRPESISFNKILEQQGVFGGNNDSFEGSQYSQKKRVSKQIY